MPVSSIIPKLYQSKPDIGSKRFHGGSWKNLHGHDANTKSLRLRHQINHRITPYITAGTINILKDMGVSEIRKSVARFTRCLKAAGVVAWMIKEVSKRSNRVHYHLLITTHHSSEELKAIVRNSLPHLKFRLQFDPVRNAKWCSGYFCKTSTAEWHTAKTVLFAKDVRIDKHGVIGDFWQDKAKAETPQARKKRNQDRKQLLAACHDSDVDAAARLISQATGESRDDVAEHFADWLISDPTIRPMLHTLAIQYWSDDMGIQFDPNQHHAIDMTVPDTPRPPRPRRPKDQAPKPDPIPWHPDQIIESVRM